MIDVTDFGSMPSGVLQEAKRHRRQIAVDAETDADRPFLDSEVVVDTLHASWVCQLRSSAPDGPDGGLPSVE